MTGSARFKRLIVEEDFTTALEVALEQVENGALGCVCQLSDHPHGRHCEQPPAVRAPWSLPRNQEGS